MLNAQDSPCLSANDVKEFRKALADRDFYKASFEESEQQQGALISQRDRWKGLYESEKHRADNVLTGGQVAELQAEVKDLRAELQIAKDQMTADRQKVGELTAENINLRSSRKWYAGTGFVAGAVTGYFLAKNQNRIVQAATGRTGFAPPESRYNFGMKFKF